jgi:type 1 fimbria pilin
MSFPQETYPMKRNFIALMAAVSFCLLGAARPASAHHAFAAEFDKDKCADFTGTLINIDWENPHAYFTMDVKGDDGKTLQMTFETSSLSTLKRAGTSKADFVNSYGKEVSVRGCPAKNGNKTKAAANYIKFADGTTHRIGQDVEGLFPGNFQPTGDK